MKQWFFTVLHCRGLQEQRRRSFNTSQYEWAGPAVLLRSSDEGDASARLVDLPHVQLLVLLQRLLELGRREAAGDAALLRLGHADHLAYAALCGQLAHQREDDVGGSLSPGARKTLELIP